MGNPTPTIKNLNVPSFRKLIIETSDDVRYEADLSALQSVYCFPADETSWKKCSIDSYGLAIIWSSRFEVHVDQVIGLATKKEKITKAG